MLLSTDFNAAKAQMEALDTAVDALMLVTRPLTITQASPPDQFEIETAYENYLDLSLLSRPIPPEANIVWHDGTRLRGSYGTLYDYVVPILTTEEVKYSTSATIYSLSRLMWYSRTELIFVGWNKAAFGSYRMALDGSTTLITTQAIHAVNATLNPVFNSPTYGVYVSGGTIHLYDFLSNTAFNTTVADAHSSNLFAVTANGDIIYLSTASSNRMFKHITFGATSATNFYDSTADFAFIPTILQIAAQGNNNVLIAHGSIGFVVRHPSTGAAVTLLHSLGASNYYIGGDLVYGAEYGGTAAVWDIINDVQLDDVDLKLGYASVAPIIKEAQAMSLAAQNTYDTQASRTAGSRLYADLYGPTTLGISRDPDNSATLIRYQRGTSYAYAVVGDSGSTGKVYPRSDYYDSHSDYRVIKEIVYDTTVKELTADWSADDMTDFGTIVIAFDNGITGATETARVQFNGLSGTYYDYTLNRMSVATSSNTNAVGAAYIDLYNINSASSVGGRYMLTIVDQDSSEQIKGIAVEGFTTTGIATGNVNSIMGAARFTPPVPLNITSVRVFLSGSTAVFAVGTRLSIVGYRTKARYHRTDAFYGPDMG